MGLEVVLCDRKKQYRDFFQVPYDIHGKESNWVPPLRVTTKRVLSHRNPFFKQAKIKMWVAYLDNKPVGRIVGIINALHNQYHSERTAFWGFFESINSEEVSQRLFSEVEQWAGREGMTSIRGPMNPSINYECGLQISAFDSSPFVMMPQHPEYYKNLVEKQGNEKIKDLQAWTALMDDLEIHAKKMQIIQSIQKKYKITIRPLNMKHFEEEMALIVNIYNDAWQNNWGFLPLNQEEFAYLAADFKQIMIPEFIFIAEIDGEPCGFSVGIPDINQILIRLRSGRLTPFNFLKLLWSLKLKKSINQGRIPLLGVLNKYQHLPIGGMLYCRHIDVIKKTKCKRAEFSWILEDNEAMQNGLQLIHATHYKTYRIYEKKLENV